MAVVDMCGDLEIIVSKQGDERTATDRMIQTANYLAGAMPIESEHCPPQPDAEHIAMVEAYQAELQNRCDDVFVLVEEPNVYQRHTVCPDDPWASLARTHKCDDLIILGETDVPSFQCRPVVDPPS